MREATTLVLGAGASRGYGFPTGGELRRAILDYRGWSSHAMNFLEVQEAELLRFLDAFTFSQAYSIDAFLGRRPEFSNVGKRIMAHLLLRYEQASQLFNEGQNDHWYQYLLNRIATDNWDELNFDWLSVVTFNYDRSLEAFLHQTLQHAYGKTPDQVISKLQSLRIVHVYGSLGALWDDQNSVPFGTITEHTISAFIKLAAENVQVIGEGRTNSPPLQDAVKLLSEAARICFLGFGFDEVNIQRLGAPHAFQSSGNVKRLCGTIRGLTMAQACRATRLVCGQVVGAPNFLDANCISLLSETLVLEPDP